MQPSSAHAGLIEPIGARGWYQRLSARASVVGGEGVVPAYLRPGVVNRPVLDRGPIVRRMVESDARVIVVIGPAGAGNVSVRRAFLGGER